MSDKQEEYRSLKTKFDSLLRNQAVLEERVRSLKEQRDQKIQSLQGLGYDTSDLEALRNQLNEDLEGELKNVGNELDKFKDALGEVENLLNPKLNSEMEID